MGSLRELLGNRSFLLLVLYFTLPALAGWVVRDWMPAILKAEFHIGQGKAGVSATLYWQIASIFGAVIGGYLADRWMRVTPRGRIFVSAIDMALIVPAMFGVGYAPQTGHLWVAIAFLAGLAGSRRLNGRSRRRRGCLRRSCTRSSRVASVRSRARLR